MDEQSRSDLSVSRDLTHAASGARGGDLCACERCRGDGFYYQVPSGFNPFSAGLMASARAAYRVECFPCRGTGVANADTSERSVPARDDHP